VLKPGALFSSYEWLRTTKYDKNNKAGWLLRTSTRPTLSLPLLPLLLLLLLLFRVWMRGGY